MKFPPLKNVYLKTYRLVGFGVLLSSLVFLFGYSVVIFFFIINNTWIAPTVLSKTSDKMLQFEGGYLSATQQQAAARIALGQTTRQVQILEKQKEELYALQEQSKLALRMETRTQQAQLTTASTLIGKKSVDIETSKALQTQLAAVREQTNKLLEAHLITRDTATQSLTIIQNFDNSVTDNQVSLLTLNEESDLIARKRQTLLGVSQSVDEMVAVKAYVDIKQALLQNENDLATAKETAVAAKRQVELADNAVANLNDTAYMAALKDGANLAFVSYDNQKVAVVGQPIYDCYLIIIGCHKVGTIKHVFHDELVIDFPLFNVRLSRTVRGFIIDMDMTHPEYMGSSVMFVGKPLYL